jgi:hypothetical protein
VDREVVVRDAVVPVDVEGDGTGDDDEPAVVVPGRASVVPGAAATDTSGGAADDVPEDDGTGRPSRPITTGESPDEEDEEDDVADDSNVTERAVPPDPDPTGTARTSVRTTPPTVAPSASRAPRCRIAPRASSAERRTAPRIRAESGGPAGAWCTGFLTGRRITIRYPEETNGARKVTVSPRGADHI